MERKHQYPPTLLERLLDDEPKSPHDRMRPLDIRGLRRIVQNDIASLLNHINIEDVLDSVQHKPAMSSVVNYGIPAMVGTHADHHSWDSIEKTIRSAILRFEPRIIPETLLVRPLKKGSDLARHAIIIFEIRGLIYWSPRPVDLCINARYDIESDKLELRLFQE